MPAPLVVPAVGKHTATVIMAHGLGDSGSGWISLAQNFRRRQQFNEVSFVFPNAPVIPITVNGGMRMPGWYDITDFSDLAQKSADEEGILRSREYIRSLIRAETVEKKIPSSRVIVGGFSQGAAVAVLTGLTSKEPLGGVFGLSGYLLLGEKVPSLVPEGVDKKALKIFMGHGEDDPLVKFEWGRMSAAKLREWGWDVEFKSYKDLGHSVDLKEMDDLEAWLKARLA